MLKQPLQLKIPWLEGSTSLPGTFSPNQSGRVWPGQKKIPEVCLGKASLQQKDRDMHLKVHLNAKCTCQGPRKGAKGSAVQETKQVPGVCQIKIKTDNPNCPKKLTSLEIPFEKSRLRTSTFWVSSRLDIVYGLLWVSEYTSNLQITKALIKHVLQPSWAMLESSLI